MLKDVLLLSLIALLLHSVHDLWNLTYEVPHQSDTLIVDLTNAVLELGSSGTGNENTANKQSNG